MKSVLNVAMFVVLGLGFSLGVSAQQASRRPRVDTELDKIVEEVRQDEQSYRRGGRIDLESQVRTLQQQNRRLVLSVKNLEARINDVEDMVLGYGGPVGRPPVYDRSFVCTVRDYYNGRNFIGRGKLKIDAEFNVISECSKSAGADSCNRGALKCEESSPYGSSTCVVKDYYNGRSFRGQGESQMVATFEALKVCASSAGADSCNRGKVTCEDSGSLPPPRR